ncbi:MAG TPA: hypothetical protein DCQ43_00155, partial [Treponema sp.]|nr:hypothetical protein [Treponema sp.]
NTNIIELNAVTKSKTATITASAISTQVPNNYLPGGSIPVAVVQNATYPTDWTITLGDATTMIPEGTTVLTITVSNTSPSAVPKVYTVTVTKDCDSESRLKVLNITSANGTVDWDTDFNKNSYFQMESKPSEFSTNPDTAGTVYNVKYTGRTATLSLQTEYTGANISLFKWDPSLTSLASGTTSLTYTTETGRSIRYTIRITSKNGNFKRKYDIQLLYAGTELATLDDAGETTPGTYEYDSNTISGAYATGWSIVLTTFSSDQNITATGQDADGNTMTCTATRDTTDLTKWIISGSTGFAIGTNKVYITVTNSNGTGSSLYTYNIERTE